MRSIAIFATSIETLHSISELDCCFIQKNQMICYPIYLDSNETNYNSIFFVHSGMVISVLFILATILVYTFLPELHNLHGSCLVCHLAGLVVAYTLTAWVKFNGWHYVDTGVCSFRGHLMYFSLISAFLWSNVICYDLWRNFR